MRSRNASAIQPLSPEEEGQLLDDLHRNRRVMYWLHNLNRRPAQGFSPDVVKALVALQEHANSAIRILANRLVKKIPQQHLDPVHKRE